MKKKSAITSKRSLIQSTKADMASIGTYKPEYDPIIEAYADIWIEYEIQHKRLVESDYQCETETAAGGIKTSPLPKEVRELRKEIRAFADCLGLTVKPMQRPETGKPVGKLTALMGKK